MAMTTPLPRELPKYTGLCRCSACGEHFNSTAAFEKHRTGTYDLNAPGHGRRCRTPDEMRDLGMAVAEREGLGWWITKPSALTFPVHRGDEIGTAPVGDSPDAGDAQVAVTDKAADVVQRFRDFALGSGVLADLADLAALTDDADDDEAA